MKKRAFLASLLALVAAPFVPRKKPSMSYGSISLKFYPGARACAWNHDYLYARFK